jgi:hypothetical protein
MTITGCFTLWKCADLAWPSSRWFTELRFNHELGLTVITGSSSPDQKSDVMIG